MTTLIPQLTKQVTLQSKLWLKGSISTLKIWPLILGMNIILPQMSVLMHLKRQSTIPSIWHLRLGRKTKQMFKLSSHIWKKHILSWDRIKRLIWAQIRCMDRVHRASITSTSDSSLQWVTLSKATLKWVRQTTPWSCHLEAGLFSRLTLVFSKL